MGRKYNYGRKVADFLGMQNIITRWIQLHILGTTLLESFCWFPVTTLFSFELEMTTIKIYKNNIFGKES